VQGRYTSGNYFQKGKIMYSISWADRLWGKQAKWSYLPCAAVILLFTLLGSHEIWTQEHRWSDIVYGMFYSHDFLHPRLDGNDYYDKPLLSYWLIAGVAIIIGDLNTWAIRIPSALAGLLAIGSMYYLGTRLKDKRLGLLAGWMLLTTFYFIFWARTSSADMLNMAGSLFAVAWYFSKKHETNLFNYIVFFLILALTALCKGLVGPMVAILAIFPDMVVQHTWKKHVNLRVLIGIIPALVIYVLPFWASTHFSAQDYRENGLYEVYRENIMRYFHPFDHKDPIYTYFLYLPIYLLPWTFFFIPALISLKVRWNVLSKNSKWIIYSTALLFLFFTFSGSRRSYYVLPILPFAILLTADWILSGPAAIKRSQWAGRIAIISFILFFLNFGVLQPLYYSKNSVKHFTMALKTEAVKIKPWTVWKFVLLDAESKIPFYLHLPPDIKNNSVIGDRENQTKGTLLKAWPVLKNLPKDTIFITRKIYLPFLKNRLKHYRVIEIPPDFIQIIFQRVLKRDMNDAPIAFIPT
jgi:4-amino-4-deoxy-L-arabinose transferase-like glycosyltransferase